jgi:hypothetical protein
MFKSIVVASMRVIGIVFLTGTLLGFSCDAAPAPSIAIIQSAYEREASNDSPLHDIGLKVIEASCDPSETGHFLCQVTFLSTTDPDQRLYFDVIAITWSEQGWKLNSGLCKR